MAAAIVKNLKFFTTCLIIMDTELYTGNPPHIIIAVVYIFISLYVYIFPVPRIEATSLNIWENNDIFPF